MVTKLKKLKKASSINPKKKDRTAKSRPEGYSWKSALSFSARSTSALLRTVLKELGISFRRQKSERSYAQLYAVVPLPRVAYVFRFRITEPYDLVIDLYDTYPGTSGALSFIEIPSINDHNIHGAREILRALASRTPRPPWKFTVAQRVQHGLLYPDILRARRNWQAIGVAD